MRLVKTNRRVWHYLRGNSRSSTPVNFVFFGCESYKCEYSSKPGVNIYKVKQWHAIATRYDGGKWTRQQESTGETALAFWRLIYSRLDPRRPMYIYGCGASDQMQLLSLGTELERGTLSWEIREYALSQSGDCGRVTWSGTVVMDDPPTVIELMHIASGCKLWILDTRNYWRSTDEEFIAEFQFRQCPTGAKANVCDWPRTYSHTSATCCATAITALVGLIRADDLGNMRWTAPAQGLQCFRHKYLAPKSILIHCHNDSLQLERDSYFGGNVSIYQLGVVKGPIYVLDYQSFYPSIMAARTVPCKWVAYTERANRIGELLRLPDHWRIARVTINSTGNVFPVRHRGKLVMATGRFTTTLHEPELTHAISTNSVERIHCVAVYTARVIFNGFVQEFWRRRVQAKSEGREVDASLYKMFLNGITGKFGQKNIRWIDEPDYYAAQAWGTQSVLNCDTGEIDELRYLNWRVQRRRCIGEAAESNSEPIEQSNKVYDLDFPEGPAINNESTQSCPQIAGAITSWGRVLLEETRHVAGDENVYYTDTDCLHCNGDGFSRLLAAGYISTETLGKLCVKCTAREAEYRGIKYYRLDDAWTVAGRKPNAVSTGRDSWTQEEWTGWSSLLYDGTTGSVRANVAQINRGEEFIPGIADSNGRVSPIRLANATLAD